MLRHIHLSSGRKTLQSAISVPMAFHHMELSYSVDISRWFTKRHEQKRAGPLVHCRTPPQPWLPALHAVPLRTEGRGQ